MFVRIGKVFLVFALVAALGAHWALLQTVAWTTMLADNLCHDSVAESVAKTFDGEHPCCLCKAIAAAKKAQKQGETVSVTVKFEYPPVADGVVMFPPALFTLLPADDIYATLLSSEPVAPPPRSCFV